MAALRKRIAELAASSASNVGGDEQPAAKQRRLADARNLHNVLQQFRCVVCLEYESLGGYGAECENGHRVCMPCFNTLQRTTIELVDVMVDEDTPTPSVVQVEEQRIGSRRCIICTPYGGGPPIAHGNAGDDNGGVMLQAREPSQFYMRLERTLTFECEHVGCTFSGAMATLKTHTAVCPHRVTKCCVRYCPFEAPLHLHQLPEHILGAAHRQTNFRAPPGNAVTMHLVLRKYEDRAELIDNDMGWAFVMSVSDLSREGFLSASDGGMKHYVVQAALQDGTLTAYVSAQQPYEKRVSMHSARIKILRRDNNSTVGASSTVRIRDCGAAERDSLKAMFTAGEALALPATTHSDCIDAFATEVASRTRTRTERNVCITIAVKLLPNKADDADVYRTAKYKKMPHHTSPLVIKQFSIGRKAVRHLDSSAPRS